MVRCHHVAQSAQVATCDKLDALYQAVKAAIPNSKVSAS